MNFSDDLQKKIDLLKSKCRPVTFININGNKLNFPSPFLLAPLAGITNAPFRLLMSELGAGGSISELISSDGVSHANQKTIEMLKIDKRERFTGIQLFGEHSDSLLLAAQLAEKSGAYFVDINMGCPVRKVVSRGAGAALLQNPKKVKELLRIVKSAISIPLTIKVRLGRSSEQITVREIVDLALEAGVAMVTIHGRTAVQLYGGYANWEIIEEIAGKIKNLAGGPGGGPGGPINVICGNGDLHTPTQARERWGKTNCSGLMLGRGALKNPFIFLKSLDESNAVTFNGGDYLQIIRKLDYYLCQLIEKESARLTLLKKYLGWFSSSLPAAANFRTQFWARECNSHNALTEVIESYFGEMRDTCLDQYKDNI